MKDDPAELSAALNDWIRSATGPQLKPLQAQAQGFEEGAFRAARSLEKRCEDLILRTRRDMFGSGDARRGRAANALIRFCKEVSSTCQEFSKIRQEDLPVSKFEASLGRLCSSAAKSYYDSGKVAAASYRSETSLLSGEIGTLRNISNQISRFQTKTRDVMDSADQIHEQAGLLVEHVEALSQLKSTRAQLGRELEEARLRIGSLEAQISKVGVDSGMRSLDRCEAELRRLRREFLQNELSRLKGPISRFLALVSRGEAEHSRQAIDVLTGYLETPLTSLAKERDGYPRLKDGLTGLLKAIERRRIGLNDRKARKASERARRILDGSLVSLQSEAREAFRARAKLLRLDAVRQLRAQRLELRAEHARLLRSSVDVESRAARVAEEITSIREKVTARLDRIEKLANDWFRKKLPAELRNRVLMAARD